MNKTPISQRIYLFFLLLFSLELYYFFIDFFLSGLFVHYGYSLQGGFIILGICITHGIILFGLIYLSYGVMNRKPWTRKFMIFFLIWASLWAIWGILVGNNIIVHLVLIIIYLIMILYLNTMEVKQYFMRLFRYGKYVLYTRMVVLKSGVKLPIFFFSSHTPKSGYATTLPEGYIVKENETSHMPYLKKEKPPTSNKNIEPKRAPQSIIYVVNSSHNDTVQGNWSVKSKQKIFSNHTTKRSALKKAREIALQGNARVIVQNINGRFSYSFKPKRQ